MILFPLYADFTLGGSLSSELKGILKSIPFLVFFA